MMPTSLQIALNLSSNLFEGPIPNHFSRLTGLEILDLSNNKFSGQIPSFLAELGALTQLSLSNNQLSGVIPHCNSWVMVYTSGNEGLINAPSPPPEMKARSHHFKIVELSSLSFYVFFVVSFWFFSFDTCRRL
ncbi:putative non-specific serine/threonine protein kinase [Rosa chinensis]|uniref:Putative non-specific serine/threonine protein kinase n=1 Tax=Rosa chinensis TaxID=74649 RepID=A0A2P6S7N4_ROSCH|nr:putative non-specific serine/threonine protein kinase [Rosa chinensis]